MKKSLSPAVHDPYASLRFKEFRYFIWAKLLLTLALQMQAVIVSWLVYEKTHDPLSLGIIGLAEAIPAISLSLYGGHIADRVSRKSILMWTTLLMFLGSVFLVLYVYNYVGSSVLLAYFVIFIIGIARGFHYPAQSAFWAQLVPKDNYVNSSTWNSTVWQLGAVAGPAFGGLCYGWFGAGKSCIIVCLFILICITYYYRIAHKPIATFNQTETLKESLLSGIKYVFKNNIFVGALSLDLFAVLFGGAVALLPVFADKILHVGPEGLGFLRAAPAVGAVIMALLMAHHPPRKNAGIKLMLCVAGFGLCMITFALSNNFYLSFGILFFSGAFDNVSVVIRSTILQSFTPDEMRGRVASVNNIFVGSSNEIGAFESGTAAKLLGLVPSVIFGGAVTLLVVAITYKLSPSLRKLQL